jgi:hypothetical protein
MTYKFFFDFCFLCIAADTGGRVDMKRIYGTTAVEGRVRLERDVKVLHLSLSLSLYIYIYIYICEIFALVLITTG